MKQKITALYNIFRRQKKIAGLPIHIQVETTNACNLRCATCHRDLLYPQPTIMKFVDFKKIYDNVLPENINVSGLGEPLLNPDIFEMIKYAKNILIDNIKELNKVKKLKKSSKPVLRFNYALQQDNIDQLIDTIKLAAKLKIPGIYIQYLEYINREDRKERLVGKISADKLKNILIEAENLAKKLKITTNTNIWMRDFDTFYNKMRPEGEFIPNNNKCYFPWFSSWIDADGTVRPCPIIPWQIEEAHMGNALKENFSDIWNNDKYQSLRAALAHGERPTGPCKTCIPQSLFNIFQIRTKLLPGRN
jgi:radical SAM protein with 4Fe4S-binding SPASM domain